MDFNRGIGGSSQGKDARPLARQGSVYSLTFDEFQSTIGGFGGKDFGSMNMDELLKNIWTAEESQAMSMASALAAGASAEAQPPAGGIQRQGSLTLPRTLSQKTVDEVWRDLMRENTATTSTTGAGTSAPAVDPQPRRQQTLGEMTLEEFLVRAGVVREDATIQPSNNNTSITNNSSNLNNTGNLFYGNTTSGISLSPYADLGVGMRAGIGDPVVGINNGVIPGAVGLGAMVSSPAGQVDGIGKGNGDLSSLSPAPYMFGGGIRGGNKNKSSGTVEKVVERRQRRMIKNRESAARSRARKQAYTMELEAEVAKLKEQNQELQRKQEEMMELQKNQVLEMINHQCGQKKRCLRRTQTGPW